MISELNFKDLKYFSNQKSTDVRGNSNDIVGQNSGAEALNFGLLIKNKGYNVYVAGMHGSGKTSYAKAYAEKIAANEPVPNDLCYIYNFDNPNEPKLLKLKAGEGIKFKNKMDELLHMLSLEIPKVFSSYEYEEERERLAKELQKNKDSIINELTEEAKKYGFGIKVGNNGGVYFLPIVDGKTINEEEFDTLEEEQKEKITEGSDEVQALASKAMKKIRLIDKELKFNYDKTDYNTALMIIGRFLTPIQEYYVGNQDVTKYLINVKEDLIKNYNDFITDDEDNNEDPIGAVIPWINKKYSEDFLSKYKVNLIVDNSNLNGAPVIIDYNPTYTNLVGEIEYESENGNFVTDFMKIKPGLLHKANGGYLLFHASDVLTNPFAWETLRKILKTGIVSIEPLKEYQLGGITVAGIQPEKCDINVKIILIGSMYYYELLKEYDDDFEKLFKICAMFDYEIENNESNISAIINMVNNYVSEENLLNVSIDGMNLLIEYSSRLAERKDKFTARFGMICDIVSEANVWAEIDKSDCINEKYIQKAIDKKNERFRNYELKYQQMINNNEIMIDTTGKKVGQINGLCVMELCDYAFGVPTRITATTYTGKAGIVNIEKEAEISGAIHNKGVQVLTGYFGMKYAQKFPLTLSCRICFEQSYSGVDGDSASSTETYAIISSLADAPINQELAVTGSMNQLGEIQPIGGVTHKIEGFFDICKNRGLTGTQGVIIPRQNINDLVLKNEVIDAVKNNQFHIYAIDDIDDGIELLMDKKAGKKLAKDGYSKDSIHYSVYEKLKKYYKWSTIGG